MDYLNNDNLYTENTAFISKQAQTLNYQWITIKLCCS